MNAVRGSGRLNWRFVAWLMGWRHLLGDLPQKWPPGRPKEPGDAASLEWERVVSTHPHLAPATTERPNADMLRLLGNGVVPDQAESAITELLERLEREKFPMPPGARKDGKDA